MKPVLFSFVLVGLCGVGSLEAHLFSFSNHTNEDARIRIHLTADVGGKWYEATIRSKKEGHDQAMHTFKFGADQGYRMDEAEWWKGGFCLGDIQISTPLMEKKQTVDDDGNIKFTYERVKDSFGKPLWNPWRNLEVLHLKSESYAELVNAGAMLADGLSELAADAATAATGVPVPAFKVGNIVKAAGTLSAYGTCKNVHYDLIPTADYIDPRLERTMFNIVAITIAK